MLLFSSCTFCVLKNQFNFYHHYLFLPQKFFFISSNQQICFFLVSNLQIDWPNVTNVNNKDVDVIILELYLFVYLKISLISTTFILGNFFYQQ